MKSSTNHLLTGVPRSGKSTVLAKTVDLLRLSGLSLGGFYTAEVRGSDGERIGFDLVSVCSGEPTPLARRDWHDARWHIGKYGVQPHVLTDHLEVLDNADVVVVDEIGRMQLLHPDFATAVTELLDAKVQVLGTIHVFDDPVTDLIKLRTDITVVSVTEFNRDELPGMIASDIARQFGC